MADAVICEVGTKVCGPEIVSRNRYSKSIASVEVRFFL